MGEPLQKLWLDYKKSVMQGKIILTREIREMLMKMSSIGEFLYSSNPRYGSRPSFFALVSTFSLFEVTFICG